MLNNSTKILHWFYKLSWKKMLGIAMFILVLGVMPLAQKIATNPTRTRSEAALLIPKPQEITTEFETPKGPPQIFLIDHFFGKVGDAVLIHGENLGGLHSDSWVSLGGRKIGVDNLVTWKGNYIEFKVPEGSTSGIVEVSILGEKISSPMTFFVTDENTRAELNLVENQLKARNISEGSELLVWLIKVRGEGELKITNANGVIISQKEINLPVGKIYEVRVKINQTLATQSELSLVSLLNLSKPKELVVGIARGELIGSNNVLIPLHVHPMYMSF